MKIFKKHTFWLVLIIALASFLRLWRLDKNPPSANWDESSIGWNAYSILKTGRDDFGQFLPLSFRSNDDYKTPLYFYLDVPFVKVLGLNLWSVRLPSALSGIASVYLTFVLVNLLFAKQKIALLSALFLAISPWSIHFSRGALEANLTIFFNLVATIFFIKGLKNPRYFVLSAVVFGLSLFNYLIPRYFLPFYIGGLFILYRKELVNKKVAISIFVVIFLIFAIPIVKNLLTPSGQIRSLGVSIFNNPSKGDRLSFYRDISAQKIQEDLSSPHPPKLPEIIHNRRYYALLLVLRGYLSHFDFNYLFLPGGILVYQTPEFGLMYLSEFPLIVAGLYFLIKKKEAGWKLVLLWLLIAPLVAAPTTSTPHASRSILMLPMLQVVTAYGASHLYTVLRKQKLGIVLVGTFILVFALNFSFYVHQYFVHYPREFSFYWQYGYEDLTKYLNENRKGYRKFIFLPKITRLTDHAHIFLLFYNKYDPATYLASGGTKLCDFGLTGRFSFDKYEFKTEVCDFKKNDKLDIFRGFEPDSLVIANPDDYGGGLLGFPAPVKTFYLYDSSTPVFKVYRSDDIMEYVQTHPEFVPKPV